ncbi:hypothetical protein AXG93_2139s1280 [Marchantia polymorpha subsp. ruderalis]|uniref:HIT domain-containing protein n=1 Tax=Marchantia polymorpha subsp. ruderalis TaxID=1480154 RepID=A0A176WMD4_MARPO|nr:hypothetical protein AXG93_2139s1280 [Marchantia polymorpha subsp. ruderalis]
MATTVKGPLEESSPQMDAYTFGPWKIDPKEVFLVTEHCYAFVNLRPVVPEEVTDLWLTAQRVGQKLEPFFNASSLTLAIQDGPEAGQTVPHVHVHVLPRKKKDFEDNDMVYDAIDKKEDELNQLKKKEDEGHLDLDQERKDRTRDEMFDEASNSVTHSLRLVDERSLDNTLDNLMEPSQEIAAGGWPNWSDWLSAQDKDIDGYARPLDHGVRIEARPTSLKVRSSQVFAMKKYIVSIVCLIDGKTDPAGVL